MGNKYADNENHQNEGDVVYSSGKSDKVIGPSTPDISESKTWSLVKGAKPGIVILRFTQSETGKSWFQELFSKRSCGVGIRVPKHLVSLDEKYLRRCLEVMHINALKGASCALSVNLSFSDMGFIPEYVTIPKSSSFERMNHAIDCPMVVGTGDLDVSSVGEGIVGSVMGSDSMMSILRSPLFQRLGISDHEARLGGTSLFENKRCILPEYQSSPGWLSLSPFQKPGKKKTLAFRNQEYRSDSVQQSPISISSGLSVPSDKSSASSSSPCESQGMLQCTWEGGIPHFAFSLEEQKELYVANVCKVEVANDKTLDYVYSFRLMPSGRNMFDFADSESDLIGKMRVSTSFSLCSNNSRVMETEFVLVGANENHAGQMQVSTLNNRRTSKFSKVMEVCKSGHSLKQRSPSLFGRNPKYFSAEGGLDFCNSLNQQGRANLIGIDFTPNFELAAIVVKDHIQHETIEKEVGGWGLKFLKKAEIKQNTVSPDASAAAECCLRNASKCSRTMDIIVPVGHHGGPKTKDGGPTSLIERWRLGGHCDCGGWDIGCPLKVLKARPRREEGLPSSESPGDCKSFVVSTEISFHLGSYLDAMLDSTPTNMGLKQGRPTLKMVNIREGLYFISFQSSYLSPLQCFSIAVAIIHSQSPPLRPKHVHD
ncbi:hypothetical protein Cgig2_029215 [Carnegiea gigantea]|uniref:Uncharacterized protein n=1 Tax=Carnegiea gigantea TaxID=171969 RepID=A0A9Q1QKK9_9CARY|nr:hypothetical protein Cgig2_029215 [Carnegiea gigantea]